MPNDSNNLPKLPVKGVNPFSDLKKTADRTYISYLGGDYVIDKFLAQHPREDKEDYEYRKGKAFSLERTEWATRFLTRTIDNKKYPVHRDFTDNPILDEIASKRGQSGTTLDSKLKEAMNECLLGGVSYIYIDYSLLQVEEGVITGNIEINILRVNQVSNIVQDSEKYITQCEIFDDDDSYDYLTRFYKKPVNSDIEVPYYEIYRRLKGKGKQWILFEEGVNNIGIVPIIPVIFNGDLKEPKTLSTPIQEVAKIDISIMNLTSDTDHSFSLHNYPWLALPSAIGGTEAGGLGLYRDEEGVKKPSKKIALGACQGFEYSSEAGQPLIIEPKNLHVDKALEIIAYYTDEILSIIGSGVDKDHPLASGVAKMFTFNDTNEAHRNIHSILENVEYSLFYIIYLIINKSNSNNESFNDFRETVKIIHPSSFDPTGGLNFEKLTKAIESPAFQIASPEIKAELQKQYWNQVFSELIPSTELNELLETIEIKENEQNEFDENTDNKQDDQPIRTGSDEPEQPDESNDIIE